MTNHERQLTAAAALAALHPAEAYQQLKTFSMEQVEALRDELKKPAFRALRNDLSARAVVENLNRNVMAEA